MSAFARENSYKRALTECLEKETHYRNEAEGLKNYIRENFTNEKVYADFVNNVLGSAAAAKKNNDQVALEESAMLAALGSLQA